MALSTIDRHNDPNFGADPNDTATFSDVPIQADGLQVLIKRAVVVTDGLNAAVAISQANELAKSLATSGADLSDSLPADSSASLADSLNAAETGGSGQSLSLANSEVPEPSSLLLAAIGFGLYGLRRRRR
jgi:hypothetical protein